MIHSAAEIRRNFEAERRRGSFLVGAAVGAGAPAAAAEKGGADFILALSAGRMRIMGAASIASMFPIREARAFVDNFAAAELLGRCSIPVIYGAGVFSPGLMLDSLCQDIAREGFSGVINWPTVVHYPERVRVALEAAGLGFSRELALLKTAQKFGLYAVAHVRTRSQAVAAAESGVDMVCLNFGWNVGGSRGHKPIDTLEEVTARAESMCRAITAANADTLFVLEGGPIRDFADMASIYKYAKVDGYIGGSTIDRIPFENSVIEQTLRFKGSAEAAKVRTEDEHQLIRFGRKLGLVGSSQVMLRVYATARTLAAPHTPLALVGEPGTGREPMAQAMHRYLGGKDGRVVTLDAAELNGSQIAIAVFGRGGGGRVAALPGLIESKEAETLILRNVERLPRSVQRRIARFVESGRYRAVSDPRVRKGALRLILLLPRSVNTPEMRDLLAEELVDMLRDIEIELPPLRDRIEDIESIFAAESAHFGAGKTIRLSPAALRWLRKHPWSGNLPELRALAARMMRNGVEGDVDEETLLYYLSPEQDRLTTLRNERSIVLDALWRNGFHRGRTAAFLGVSRKTLYNKIVKYGLVE